MDRGLLEVKRRKNVLKQLDIIRKINKLQDELNDLLLEEMGIMDEILREADYKIKYKDKKKVWFKECEIEGYVKQKIGYTYEYATYDIEPKVCWSALEKEY